MARILGLDIGARAVYGTLLRTAFRKTEMLRYVESPIGHVPGGDRDAAVRAAIVALLDGLRPLPDALVMNVAGTEASLRVVELPLAVEKRASEVLPFELEALLPFSIEDAVIDYQPISRGEGKTKLLAAAAPRERIATQLAHLRDLGLEPRELAVGAAVFDGLVPIVPALSGPGPFVIVDVRDDSTDVCVLRDGRCHLARTLSAGAGPHRGGASLEMSLRQSLVSYRSAGGPAPVLAFVSGESPISSSWLTSVLDVDAQMLPLPALAENDGVRPQFARSAALAGRMAARGKRIDLRKGEFESARTMGAVRQQVKTIAIGAAVVFAAFIFSTYTRWAILDDEREALQAKLGTVTRDLFGQEVTTVEGARQLVNGGATGVDPLPTFDAFGVLDALSARLPEDVTHDTRRFLAEINDEAKEGTVTLSGTVANQAAFDTVATQFDGHPCVHDVEQGRTTPVPGEDKLSYELEAVVRCPGEGTKPTKTKPAGGADAD